MLNDIKDLRSYPPMTADGVVLTVNEILANRGATLISKRTLRFYTSQDVVPAPMGSPKFARYGYEHLLSLLGARAMQDQGQKLDQIRMEMDEIRRGRLDRIEALVESWMGQTPPQRAKATRTVREGSDSYQSNKLAKLGTARIRIPLTTNCNLEVADSADMVQELERASRELSKLIEKVRSE